MDTTNPPVFFCEWLKIRRNSLDLTQTELAERAGCSVSAFRKIESGERRPSKQLAGLLAKALEIPADDQDIFVRVARGELNLERLSSPSLTSDCRADCGVNGNATGAADNTAGSAVDAETVLIRGFANARASRAMTGSSMSGFIQARFPD
jgi:transcriptional regulator with XRE-family HTH domain